jgi:hypothetical protein
LGGESVGGGSIDAAAPDTANDLPTTADGGTAGDDASPGNLPIKNRTGMKSAGCGKPSMGAVATTFTNHRISIPACAPCSR